MLDKSQVYQLIDGAKIGRLAQLDTRNGVHAIPFVFVRFEDALYSPVDRKPKRHAKLSRLEWIKTAPKVCVLIDEYAEDWSTLWWLRVYGDASRIDSSFSAWDGVTEMLASKYQQYQDIAMFNGEPTMMQIKLDEWRHWSAAS